MTVMSQDARPPCLPLLCEYFRLRGRFKHPVAQALEHYGTLKTWAVELGLDQAKQLLEATLAEEKRLTRPSRNLRKTKSTSTLRLPEAVAATDSVRPRPFNKAREASFRHANASP